MLPEISGEKVLKDIRESEKKMGIGKKDRVKIIICSALSDFQNVMNVLKKECDAYISKQFDRMTIFNTLKK
jgi:CheY-like chemotaxis protein